MAIEPVSAEDAVLSATQVSAGYGQKPVLQGLNLHIKPGEIYALLGAKKSTPCSVPMARAKPRH